MIILQEKVDVALGVPTPEGPKKQEKVIQAPGEKIEKVLKSDESSTKYTFLADTDPLSTDKKKNKEIIEELTKELNKELDNNRTYISNLISSDLFTEIEKEVFSPLGLTSRIWKQYYYYAFSFEFDEDIQGSDPRIYKLKLKSGVTPLHIYAISATKESHIRYVMRHKDSCEPEMRAKDWKHNTPAHLLALSFPKDCRQVMADEIIKNPQFFKVKNGTNDSVVSFFIKRLIGDRQIIGFLRVSEYSNYFENIIKNPLSMKEVIQIKDKKTDIQSFCLEFLLRKRTYESEYGFIDSSIGDASTDSEFNISRDFYADIVSTINRIYAEVDKSFGGEGIKNIVSGGSHIEIEALEDIYSKVMAKKEDVEKPESQEKVEDKTATKQVSFIDVNKYLSKVNIDINFDNFRKIL